MSNKNSTLLNPTEILDIYGPPILNDIERQEHFTLNKAETNLLKTHTNTKEAIYFLVCLVFFKIKGIFVEFNYQDITVERQYLMKRYFPGKPLPKSLPVKYIQSQIKSKILNLCGYQRFEEPIKDTIFKELCASAANHPRQRQLCKEFLNSCVKYKVAIPGYTTLQDVVSNVWNHENKRVRTSYIRHTTSPQRAMVLSLLDKTDDLHHIISIKQDMKGFKTHDLWSELEKQEVLKPIFEIAKLVIPKLSLPMTTIEYYASLIHYYSGPGLKQLNLEAIGLYLLCYTFTRYQMLNDNLLDAFKKRTSDYKSKAKDYADTQSLKYMEMIKNTRERVSQLLIAINNDPHPVHMLKGDIYTYIQKDELLIAAKLLVDENLNQDILFWKYIDSEENSIKLNLRQLFLKIDFIVTNHDALRDAVNYVKKHLEDGTFGTDNSVDIFKTLFAKHYHEYVISHDSSDNNKEKIIHNRCEFLLYMQMMYHLSTNKLTLAYSIKHKKIEDELFSDKKWKKGKKVILKNLDYSKLLDPIKTTLNTKNRELTALYKTVNHAIENGQNEFVIIKKNKKGEDTWSLSPIEPLKDPNDSLFANVEQRSIVDIIKFVNQKTKFCHVFDPILPRASKGTPDHDVITAVAFANAIRVGAKKMSDISDLNTSAMLTAEASCVRVDTITSAIDKINNEIAKLPIYKEWYINSILHGSLDGLKLGASEKNVKVRHSKKYFNAGVGVSGYNEIVNFLSVAGHLIGSNEYEGHFTFEMVHHQNTSEIKPKHISTDKHGINSLNFALFDFTDLVFAPRIPKPHRETLWGFGSAKDYEGMLVRPTQFVDEELFYKEWDNVQRLVASILTGETSPSIIIRKLSSNNYISDTKRAFVQYNHIVRSRFILLYLHDYEFRRAIMYALNRGELYNSLYRSIAILNNGELKGKSEIEMEIWNQCTRLIAAIMHFYNAYILNSFYTNSTDPKEKEFLAGLSPTAWIHINLLGFYQFLNRLDDKSATQMIDQWINECNWQEKTTERVELVANKKSSQKFMDTVLKNKQKL